MGLFDFGRDYRGKNRKKIPHYWQHIPQNGAICSGDQLCLRVSFRGVCLLSPMVSRPLPVRRKIPIFLEEKTKNLQNGFPRNTLPNAQSAAPRNGMTATADHPGEISRTGITVRFPIRSPKRGSRISLNIPQNAGSVLFI